MTVSKSPLRYSIPTSDIASPIYHISKNQPRESFRHHYHDITRWGWRQISVARIVCLNRGVTDSAACTPRNRHLRFYSRAPSIYTALKHRFLAAPKVAIGSVSVVADDGEELID